MMHRESVGEDISECIHMKELHDGNRHKIPILPDQNEDLLADLEDEWSDLERLEYLH